MYHTIVPSNIFDIKWSYLFLFSIDQALHRRRNRNRHHNGQPPKHAHQTRHLLTHENLQHERPQDLGRERDGHYDGIGGLEGPDEAQLADEARESYQDDEGRFPAALPHLELALGAGEDPREDHADHGPPEADHGRGNEGDLPDDCQSEGLGDGPHQRPDHPFNGAVRVLQGEVRNAHQGHSDEGQDDRDPFQDSAFLVEEEASDDHGEDGGRVEQQRRLGDGQVHEAEVVSADGDVADHRPQQEDEVVLEVVADPVVEEDDDGQDKAYGAHAPQAEDLDGTERFHQRHEQAFDTSQKCAQES